MEDDPSTARAMVSLLEMNGWEATCVATVQSGLRALAMHPDAVILDLMLPDGNGEVVLQAIRAQQLPIRVLVCSAMREPDRLSTVQSLAPEAIFTKPVTFEALLAALTGNA